MRRNPARWRMVEARLGRESEIWLSTVRYDSRPHLVPVWFVWHEEKIYFATGTDTQKWTNLHNNQMVSLALSDPNNVIIVEGEAHATGNQVTDLLADHFYDKYEWDFRYDDSTHWRLVEVTPHKILVWGDGHDEKEGIRIL